MTYAAISDVQGYIPLFAISATSRPSTTQVTTFLTNRATEIDMAIRSRGLVVPVTDAGWLSELVLLNAKAAAGDTQNAAFPADAGPGSTSLGPALLREYNARLDQIRKGIGVPVAVAVLEADLGPIGSANDGLVTDPFAGLGEPGDFPGNYQTRPLFRLGQRF